MPWGAALAVGGSLIAGSMQADAAGDAADAQSRSADKADATQRYQYDTTRQDMLPTRLRGDQAGNALQMRLGLGGTGSGRARTPDEVYADLVSQWNASSDGPGSFRNNFGLDGGPVTLMDESAMRAQAQRTAADEASRPAEPKNALYGSLINNFTADDLNSDPVYQSGLQFGLDEGTKGINRMAAASGNSLSGATLKALTRFGNDYGSTKANESFNRFNTNQNSIYNKLAGVSGAGQQATNQVSAAGQNMANNVSNNALYAGSVRGASAIAQGNALTGAMNNIYGIGKKKGWWDTGSGGGLSDFTPSYAGTGNPFNWTNGDS